MPVNTSLLEIAMSFPGIQDLIYSLFMNYRNKISITTLYIRG